MSQTLNGNWTVDLENAGHREVIFLTHHAHTVLSDAGCYHECVQLPQTVLNW